MKIRDIRLFYEPAKKIVFAQKTRSRARVCLRLQTNRTLNPLCHYSRLQLVSRATSGRPTSCIGFRSRSHPEHMVKDSTSLPNCHARRHCVKCDPKLSLVLDNTFFHVSSVNSTSGARRWRFGGRGGCKEKPFIKAACTWNLLELKD